jgi:hypothetical protein
MKKFLIYFLIFSTFLVPALSSAQEAIKIEAAFVSTDGTDQLVVYVSNSNPQNLTLVAKYGEDFKFDLTSNTLTFDGYGRGAATISTIGRPGRNFQYRLVDTKGVLLPSDIYTFTSYAGDGSFSYVPSYLVLDTSSDPNNPNYVVSSDPVPTVPPNSKTNPDSPNPVILGASSADKNISSSGNINNLSTASDPSNSNTGLIPCDNSTNKQCDFKALMTLINNVITFILVKLAVPIAAIMFFYAGFKMVTSGGSAEAKGQAKNVFTSTVIGLLFVAGSWLIIKTILSILGYNGAWIGF